MSDEVFRPVIEFLKEQATQEMAEREEEKKKRDAERAQAAENAKQAQEALIAHILEQSPKSEPADPIGARGYRWAMIVAELSDLHHLRNIDRAGKAFTADEIAVLLDEEPAEFWKFVVGEEQPSEQVVRTFISGALKVYDKVRCRMKWERIDAFNYRSDDGEWAIYRWDVENDGKRRRSWVLEDRREDVPEEDRDDRVVKRLEAAMEYVATEVEYDRWYELVESTRD